MPQQIQLRRGTSAEWTSADPVLAEGELGINLDSGLYKVGDGSSAWSALSYAAGTGDGYLNIPQNSQSGNYTTVMADSGKHLLHPSGAGAGDTFTIDSNANVAFELGTAITFVNLASDDVSIAITSDTLIWAQDGTTGTRTLAENGIATALKVGTTTWLISGTGLS